MYGFEYEVFFFCFSQIWSDITLANIYHDAFASYPNNAFHWRFNNGRSKEVSFVSEYCINQFMLFVRIVDGFVYIIYAKRIDFVGSVYHLCITCNDAKIEGEMFNSLIKCCFVCFLYKYKCTTRQNTAQIHYSKSVFCL